MPYNGCTLGNNIGDAQTNKQAENIKVILGLAGHAFQAWGPSW